MNEEGRQDTYESYNYDNFHLKTQTNQDIFHDDNLSATEQSSDIFHSQLKQAIPKFLNCSVSVTKVSCGKLHWAILANNCKVYTMGNNSYGQLGIGREFKSNFEDISQRISNNSMEYSSENTFIAQPKFVFGIINPITNIEWGWHHTLAITNTNDIYVWGRGDRGQLGIGRAKKAQILPIKIEYFSDKRNKITVSEFSAGKSHSLFISKEGRVFVWGSHFLTSVPNYVTKNVGVEWLSQIDKDMFELNPVEIGIPDWIDNHEKIKTSFVIRSASFDNIPNTYQPSSLFTSNMKNSSITQVNIKNQIKKNSLKQSNDSQTKSSKGKRNSKLNISNLQSEIVTAKGSKLQNLKTVEKNMTEDKRKAHSKQSKRLRPSWKEGSIAKTSTKLSLDRSNKENVNESNQNTIVSNKNTSSNFETFNCIKDAIKNNIIIEKNNITASFNSSKKLNSSLNNKSMTNSNGQMKAFVSQSKNETLASEASANINMIDTKTLVKLIQNMEKKKKKKSAKKPKFIPEYSSYANRKNCVKLNKINFERK